MSYDRASRGLVWAERQIQRVGPVQEGSGSMGRLTAHASPPLDRDRRPPRAPEGDGRARTPSACTMAAGGYQGCLLLRVRIKSQSTAWLALRPRQKVGDPQIGARCGRLPRSLRHRASRGVRSDRSRCPGTCASCRTSGKTTGSLESRAARNPEAPHGRFSLKQSALRGKSWGYRSSNSVHRNRKLKSKHDSGAMAMRCKTLDCAGNKRGWIDWNWSR